MHEVVSYLSQASVVGRYSAAVAEIMLKTEAVKNPLKRKRAALKRSMNRVDCACEALEKKMLQRRHKFLHKYVPLMEVGCLACNNKDVVAICTSPFIGILHVQGSLCELSLDRIVVINNLYWKRCRLPSYQMP